MLQCLSRLESRIKGKGSRIELVGRVVHNAARAQAAGRGAPPGRGAVPSIRSNKGGVFVELSKWVTELRRSNIILLARVDGQEWMAVANMFERIIHGDSRVKDDGERKYPSDLDLSKTRTCIPRVNNSVQQKTGANRGVSDVSQGVQAILVSSISFSGERARVRDSSIHSFGLICPVLQISSRDIHEQGVNIDTLRAIMNESTIVSESLQANCIQGHMYDNQGGISGNHVDKEGQVFSNGVEETESWLKELSMRLAQLRRRRCFVLCAISKLWACL
ncbi:hypothetical protein LOK49_Contig264G00002 [Camellia lanceoleosa]|nr:hypothetical protein LOK49_Contig264G00002 [Camellia lanceoleosa]